MSRTLALTSWILLALVAALMVYCNYLVFCYVPNERVMGAVQRIFYFHVGSAIACYWAVVGMLIGAIGYLATGQKELDRLNRSAGEVAFLFCSIVLVSGMIWGHRAWNAWFHFEPRLITFLLIWLMLLGFCLLLRFGDQSRLGNHAAILAILVAISIPIMIVSIKFWPHQAQVHPQVMENRGLPDPRMRSTLFVCMGSLALLCTYLMLIRYRLESVQEKLLKRSTSHGNA